MDAGKKRETRKSLLPTCPPDLGVVVAGDIRVAKNAVGVTSSSQAPTHVTRVAEIECIVMARLTGL